MHRQGIRRGPTIGIGDDLCDGRAGGVEDVQAKPRIVQKSNGVTLRQAFAFGADAFTRPTANESAVSYTKVVQGGANFSYSAGQGYGYTDTADLDTTPNNRGVYSGDDELYDQFIGARNGGQIVFRVDVPNGLYRLVAAGGDAQYADHVSTITVQDGAGGAGLALVQDYEQTVPGRFWTVGFDDKVAPPADGTAPDPTLVAQPDSGILAVTQGYLQISQQVGQGSSGQTSGGDLSLLEIWQLDAQSSSGPVASFTAFPTGGPVPLPVLFFNNSTGASSYLWDFGDAITSTQSGPTHTYTVPGVYTVTLTVSDAVLTDTLTRTSYITVTQSAIERDWRPITTTTTPPVSGEHALAFDAAGSRVVLYGGNATGWPYETSTWDFDGSDWTEVTTGQTPQARYGMRTAYLPGEGVLLFGGSDESDTALNQTWVYTNSNWSQVTGSMPPARTYAALTPAGDGP